MQLVTELEGAEGEATEQYSGTLGVILTQITQLFVYFMFYETFRKRLFGTTCQALTNARDTKIDVICGENDTDTVSCYRAEQELIR